MVDVLGLAPDSSSFAEPATASRPSPPPHAPVVPTPTPSGAEDDATVAATALVVGEASSGAWSTPVLGLDAWNVAAMPGGHHWRSRALRSCQPQHRSFPGPPRAGGPSAGDGLTRTATRLMTTSPRHTWRLLVARRRCPPHLLCAPRLALGAAGWMPFRGLCEAMLAVGRRGTVDRALNLCTASRFSQWMVVSQCANALATVDGSPPPMVMGGVRSSPS